MSAPLLQTKLNVPQPRPDMVSRPRLVQRLNEGLLTGRRLALLSAPAGFGKTTLLAEWASSLPSLWTWLREGERPCAWLSLDDGDNDPARFLTYLAAALRTIDPNMGHSVEAMLKDSPTPSPESALTSLINDIAATPNPFAVVLDDYHLIHTLPIHEHLAFLLRHQPPQMHVVIASREDPPLPLSRLRARAQMVEIRQADLVFTPAEANTFLAQTMGLELSASDAVALQRRTEGWIAGLQLAALSLRDTADAQRLIDSFAGSHRYILDYLIEEVFDSQPRHVQDFLLKSSILDRFTASLCDAVVFGIGHPVEGSPSRDILLTLDQENLFVVPLDESRAWYRYHRLFADLLRQQLRRAEVGTLVPDLHRRASRWFEAKGYHNEALEHALAGSEWERAARLLLHVEEQMLQRGEVATLLRWLRALPAEQLERHPGLYLSFSWALILTGQLDAAESILAQAKRGAEGKGEQLALLGDVVAAEAFIARARGDNARTIELSTQALAHMPEDNLAGRSILFVNLGIAQWSRGHLEEAERALKDAELAGRRSGNAYARLTALGFLGAVKGAQGLLHKAAERLRRAIETGGESPPAALAYNTLSGLLYEWNLLEEASELAEKGTELGARSGNVEIQIGGYRTMARLHQAQGNESAALKALQAAHRIASERDVSPLMRARNAACHVQIALARGNVDLASHWAARVTEDADGSSFYPLLGLTPARMLLAQEQRSAAAEDLRARYELAARGGWGYGLIEVRCLQALAAATPDDSVALLDEALVLAEPEDYVRTFLDKGPAMAELLREAERQGRAAVYARKLLRAFSAPPAPRSPLDQRLIEPLSDRELEVLTLLADDLTYQEIGEALFISINTVKTHLRSVYGKLGAHDRHDAVAEARALALLP